MDASEYTITLQYLLARKTYKNPRCIINSVSLFKNNIIESLEKFLSASLYYWRVHANFNCAQLVATLWIVAHQTPLSVGFSRQEYWFGLPFASPGDLPDPGIEPCSTILQADSLPSEPPGKPIFIYQFHLVQSQLCLTLCNPMDCSTSGFPVHHQLPEFTQTHVHQVSDAIQPSHPLASPSPPALNLSQHQGLFE